MEAIEGLAPGAAALLFGVTGSGKTLVYLEAVQRVLARGRGAIVLVPEIGLTPQTVSRLRGAFGDQVAVLHSALSDGERADAWRLLRRGERRVAVGARSAIFAPVQDLGIVVVDEEHEASYKNGEAPRYLTRDVAAVRARIEGATLVLGSATPSLEAMTRSSDRLRLLRLPERIGARPLPPVEIVDLRVAPKVAGTGPVAWSVALDEAITGDAGARGAGAAAAEPPGLCGFPALSRLRRGLAVPALHHLAHRAPRTGGPPLPLLRSRGAAPVHLPQVRQPRAADARRRHPAAGAGAGGALSATRGSPRMDLDTTSTKWSHQRILGAVERGEVDLLIGTQMIAKGLDFPNVTLVGVVDADTGLYLPDFRAAERTFQLLAQVAGRAGRGPKGGRVIVQTRHPQHHALIWSARHDVEGFLREELDLRRAPPYPPEVHLVNLVVSGEDEALTANRAAELADWCNALVARYALEMMVLGPAPCPLAKIKDRWRWHVLLKGQPEVLGRIVRYAARRLPRAGKTRIVIDRDPVSLL